MPASPPMERLQPALLDRLIDNQRELEQEPREARLIDRRRLQEALLRDLAALFNTTRLGDAEFDGYEHARRSVINFGLPALAGATASTLDMVDLERSLKQAILDYEPRILPASLRVEALAPAAMLETHNVVSIQIRGMLWAHPVPLELLLRTDVDLETGQVEVLDLGRAA